MKLWPGKGIRDYETEQRLLDTQVNMELEHNDALKANAITFKFVAFKTPSSLPEDIKIPSRLFFTFKFYTFEVVTTEIVDLKLPEELETGNKKREDTLKNATQYFLVPAN